MIMKHSAIYLEFSEIIDSFSTSHGVIQLLLDYLVSDTVRTSSFEYKALLNSERTLFDVYERMLLLEQSLFEDDCRTYLEFSEIIDSFSTSHGVIQLLLDYLVSDTVRTSSFEYKALLNSERTLFDVYERMLLLEQSLSEDDCRG
ncbi:MAG: hypothetical protein RSC10_09745 [Longicatena sp.]